MISLRSILFIILLSAFALLFACGGGEEGETSSEATAESQSSEYPSKPEELVRRFFDEGKSGNVKDAVNKYVQNSDEFYARITEKGDVKEFEEGMKVIEVSITEVDQTSENSAMVTINYTHLEENGRHTIQVVKENGKWKIEEKFWQ